MADGKFREKFKGLINNFDDEGNKTGKTGFGKICEKAVKFIPAVAGEAFDVFVRGESPLKAVGDLIDGMCNAEKDPNSDLTPEQRVELRALINEAEKNRNDYEVEIMSIRKDVYGLTIADKASARNREVSMAQAGKSNWIQNVVVIFGLISFGFVIYAVVYVVGAGENLLFVHLLGIIETVVVSIFAYYLGSSKGSRDKDERSRLGN
jgi:hypothetical protein